MSKLRNAHIACCISLKNTCVMESLVRHYCHVICQCNVYTCALLLRGVKSPCRHVKFKKYPCYYVGFQDSTPMLYKVVLPHKRLSQTDRW